MAMFFWFLVKSDMSNVRYCTRVHWPSHFFQGTRKTRPCLTCQPVFQEFFFKSDHWSMTIQRQKQILEHVG